MDSENEVPSGKENSPVLEPASPNFLKPKPIKLRRKPRRLLAEVPLKELDINNNKNESIGFLRKSPKKPCNPFKCTDNKRKRGLETEDEESSNSLLWHMTNNKIIHPSKEVSRCAPSPVHPSIIDEDAHFGFSETRQITWQTETNKVATKVKHKTIPVDWSLKTKVRLTSSKPFPWRTSFKTSEEASGTTGFVRCLHSDRKGKEPCNLDSSHGAKFFQQNLIWIHPSLPWLNLFPRMESASTKSNSSAMPLTNPVQEILHSKWCDSFRSLYQLVRTFQCPYFYLCAPSFTVLFRASGVASILEIHAIITPSTQGFRNALTEEGVVFTMPLCQSSDSGIMMDEELSPSESQNTDDTTPSSSFEDQGFEADDEPEVWLESLGLSQDDFPSLKKKRKDGKTKMDRKPESLVYVEGYETQALVNFLLNSSACYSKVGPMAGVPPTLISPTAFLGATLQPLKIHHGKVRVEKGEHETVELSGPVLPSTVHSLCSLLTTTQEGNFSIHLSAHAPTLAFSKFAPPNTLVPSVFATASLKDCGLPQSFVPHMCSKTETVLSTVTAQEGFFTWT